MHALIKYDQIVCIMQSTNKTKLLGLTSRFRYCFISLHAFNFMNICMLTIQLMSVGSRLLFSKPVLTEYLSWSKEKLNFDNSFD